MIDAITDLIEYQYEQDGDVVVVMKARCRGREIAVKVVTTHFAVDDPVLAEALRDILSEELEYEAHKVLTGNYVEPLGEEYRTTRDENWNRYVAEYLDAVWQSSVQLERNPRTSVDWHREGF
jgi:hypothetical protein